ncbi:MAG: NAD-dependent DNA ligase LigA [Gemmatimonadetes bacterium]|nr:NAD-dependent DNA ligase LigA [Gemmatimonadota bacterium]
MPDEALDLDTPAEELPPDDARELVATIRAEIARHDRLYHVDGHPEISDARYDRLFQRLQEVEKRFPHLQSDTSPTQRVAGEPRGELPTLPHAAPMLSLDSTQDPEEVRRFLDRMRKALGSDEIEYLLEPKLDGVSLELVYERGVLARAVTRGNGREGEGVIDNVRTIPSVPLRLREADRGTPEFLSVRGEVLMSLSAFEALNEELVKAGVEPYSNPRNSASGALRQLDASITARRPLQCLAYDVLEVRGPTFRSDEEVVGALREWGFPIPERVRTVRSVDEILEYHAAFERDRDSLDYEIDGIVVKLNGLRERTDLGATAHHPRWAIAFKFEPRKEITRIERIVIQVGRTGVLTPVALLLPVEVGGVTVSRASLHNREELERRDIREEDLVRVQRAGDVIPQVVEVIAEEGRTRAAPFSMPDRCPECRTPVQTKGPFTVCPNRLACPAQLKGRLSHFASREGLDIEGLGSETASLLVERGLVTELADVFDLEEQDLLPLPGFAEKSARNLTAAIRSRRTTELRRFLYAVGIPEVGSAVAGDLASHFGTLERLWDAGEEDIQDVGGVGPRMAEQIRGFFQEPANRAAVARLRDRMEALTVPTGESPGGPFHGRRFVFTGTLESMSRSRAKELVEDAGGRAVSSVSGETHFLVAGAGRGSKLEAARKLGVTILSEQEFLAMLADAGIGL